jgi:vanillate O-demethylase monooxygenase subunit
MYHGMKFEPGGKCTQIPGQDMIPPKLGVRSYPVVEHYNLIWIWMGDIEKADPNLIVDYPPLADPKWRGLPGYMHYKANWLLIVDNLSDFAHLAFVHTHTLGGSEEYAYKTKPVAIEKLDDGFRVERWHMNADPPPYHCKVIPNRTDKIDRRNIGRMIVPGIFLLDTMFAPAGQGAEKGVQVPGTRQYRNAQFMTPETRSTTHFFWNYRTISTSTTRTSRCRCATASRRPFTRIWRSSRRSKKCSTPIRTISCSPSVRMPR